MGTIRSLLATVVLAVPLVAAAPGGGPSAAPPEGIDYEMTVTVDEPGVVQGAGDTGGVNVWTHLSLWDPVTCSSESPDNKCDKTLVFFEDGGDASLTLTPQLPGMDFDLVVWESREDGGAYSDVGQSQNEIRPVPGEGPIPVPGPETVEFTVEPGSYYLAVVFYRAGAGGYELRGEVSEAS